MRRRGGQRRGRRGGGISHAHPDLLPPDVVAVQIEVQLMDPGSQRIAALKARQIDRFPVASTKERRIELNGFLSLERAAEKTGKKQECAAQPYVTIHGAAYGSSGLSRRSAAP
ncbi:hypothetical protein D3C73_901600 [compost metagenome]